MEIDKKYKLERAVSTDSSRTSLNNIAITRRHAMATNGQLLVIVPVNTAKNDTPGWLTPTALTRSRKVSPRSMDAMHIHLDGCQSLPDGSTLPRPNEVNPPKIKAILRNAMQNKKFKIAFNARLLKDLADAMGTDEVTMTFEKADRAILVRPLRNHGEVGILMPVKMNP